MKDIRDTMHLGLSVATLESSIYCFLRTLDTLADLASQEERPTHNQLMSARELVRDGMGPISAVVNQFYDSHKEFNKVVN